MGSVPESMGGCWLLPADCGRSEEAMLAGCYSTDSRACPLSNTAKTLVATRSLGRETQVFPLGLQGSLNRIIEYSVLSAGGT